MENDKEAQEEKPSSSQGAEIQKADGNSRIKRSPKKKRSGIFDKAVIDEYWTEARRQFRRVRKVLANQFADLRSAFLDLKTRINAELNPDAPRRDDKVRPSAPATPLKEVSPKERPPRESSQKDSPSASPTFSIRPAGLPEQATKLRRILVVGGMDFFGAALVRHLNHRGIREIVMVDSLDDERWKNLPALRFEDLLSPEEFSANLGSRTRGPGSFSHVFYLAGWDGKEAPLALPKSLVSHVAESGGRLISLSSACSLGPAPNRRDLALGRPENLRPETRPGVLANLFDRYATARLPARSFLSLKHYRLFGLHERRDDSIYGLVKLIQEQIAETGSIVLPENFRPESPEGARRHDFLHVREAVRMAVFLAESEESAGLYEIGSGSSLTVAELARAVFEVLGRKPAIAWSEPPAAIPSPQPEKADLARLREAGWTQPQPTLPNGLRDYLENRPDEDVSLEEEEEEEPPAAAANGKIPITPVTAPTKIFPARRKPFSPKSAA